MYITWYKAHLTDSHITYTICHTCFAYIAYHEFYITVQNVI